MTWPLQCPLVDILGFCVRKNTNKTTTKVHFYYSPQTISNQSPCSVYFQNAVMIHEWCSQPQRNYCTDSYKQYYLMLFNIIKSICACKQLWGHRMSHSICFPHAAAMLICSKCSSLSLSRALLQIPPRECASELRLCRGNRRGKPSLRCSHVFH